MKKFNRRGKAETGNNTKKSKNKKKKKKKRRIINNMKVGSKSMLYNRKIFLNV